MLQQARRISGVGFVLAVFATSRIFYLVSGFLLAKFVPTSSHQLTTTDVPEGASISGHIGTVSTMSRSLRLSG